MCNVLRKQRNIHIYRRNGDVDHRFKIFCALFRILKKPISAKNLYRFIFNHLYAEAGIIRHWSRYFLL